MSREAKARDEAASAEGYAVWYSWASFSSQTRGERQTIGEKTPRSSSEREEHARVSHNTLTPWASYI